jgi:hypothetical protein
MRHHGLLTHDIYPERLMKISSLRDAMSTINKTVTSAGIMSIPTSKKISACNIVV